MSIIEERAALVDEAEALAAKGADMTADEQARATQIAAKLGEMNDRIKSSTEAANALRTLTEVKGTHAASVAAPVAAGTLGERFIKSAAMRDVREMFPKGISPEQAKGINVVARDLGNAFVKSETPDAGAGEGSSVLYRGAAGLPVIATDLGIDDAILRNRRTSILGLITHGTTDAGSLRYRQLVAFQNNAAIVPESTDVEGDEFLKPISTIELAPATAVDSTYADGFYVTTQEFNDDGALRAVIDGFLRRNLELKSEDMILNGSGEGEEPLGILNADGLQVQTFDTDILTTVRKARSILDTNGYVPTALVVSPADAEKIDLLKMQNGSYYGGGPVDAGNTPSLWGVPIVTSSKMEEGTALLGDWSTIHLLTREAVQVNIFEQHRDFAQRNLLYIRAEYRALQLLRAPASFVKVELGN